MFKTTLKRYVLPSVILSFALMTSPNLVIETSSTEFINISLELIPSAHAKRSKKSYSKRRHYSSNESSSSKKKSKKPVYIVPEIEFIGMKSPSTEQQKNSIYSEAQLKITYPDGSVKTNPLVYFNLMSAGQRINSLPVGGIYNVKGENIIDGSDSRVTQDLYSNMPSGSSLLYFPNMKATEKGGYPIYFINQYYDISYQSSKGDNLTGQYPMTMSLSLVNQNTQLPTGDLSVQNYRNIDLQDIRGIWKPAGASQTPWYTHLGSEHQEPDAKLVESGQVQLTSMMNYVAKNYAPKAYHYGYIPEMMVALDGTHKVVKHYTLGRFSHHTAKVMPDRKTVYLTDDTAYGGLFMFVADKARDLSAGTLYGAKWTQVSNEQNGVARLTWIKLGQANSKEIEELANSLKFNQIFTEITEDQGQKLPPESGYKKIKTNGKVEWLKLNANMEKAGAFLETRRFAGLMGATTEFSHLKGIALNQRDKKLYVAVSQIDDGLLINKDDPVDDIQMQKLQAGGIYEMNLSRNIVDSKNERINSDYVATTMRGHLFGEDLAQPDSFGNTAHNDKFANPSYLDYSEPLKTLFIGEKSQKMHVNNYVWAFHADHKKLSRILSMPNGSQIGHVNAVENYNLHNYLTISTQQFKTKGTSSKAELGYISGFPTIIVQDHK